MAAELIREIGIKSLENSNRFLNSMDPQRQTEAQFLYGSGGLVAIPYSSIDEDQPLHFLCRG